MTPWRSFSKLNGIIIFNPYNSIWLTEAEANNVVVEVHLADPQQTEVEAAAEDVDLVTAVRAIAVVDLRAEVALEVVLEVEEVAFVEEEDLR
jgi:hypothetical protein